LSHSIDGFDVALGQWADYIEIGVSKDADGESKYIATGKIVSKDQSEIGDFLNSRYQPDQEKLILYIATDIEDGFSGGPVVDRDGHVIGVISRIYNKAKPNEVATALKIIKHDELTQIWQDLDRSY
jgi:S1-C subfamily serine protease